MYARAAQPISLATVLASPQPTIDLRLEAFEKSSQLFLDAVKGYTRRAIEEISRRRDADASRVQKDTETKKKLELEIAEWKEKEVELLKSESVELIRAKIPPMTTTLQLSNTNKRSAKAQKALSVYSNDNWHP